MAALMAAVTLTAGAIPAKPGVVRTLQLADGSTVTARLVGDEFGHFWKADDGKVYRTDETNSRFVVIDAEMVKTHAATRRNMANAQRVGKLAAPKKVGQVGNYTGKKKGLIILVNFQDVKFKEQNNLELWKRIANEKNFNYGNFKGSMYDYFYAQSDSIFELQFDVVGPVSVSKEQSYYGTNTNQGDDMYPATMVAEACKLVDSQVNFADYDWDGDKYVDQVYVVYAGKGEADSGISYTIWPHAWSLSAAHYYGDGPGTLTLDKVKIDTYACGGELNGSTGKVAGIGTMCHEFSHCLGYPDFYDTDYSGGQGMGYWDLMDGGAYNGDGYQPCGYTSYERWMAGWRKPVELKKTKTVSRMKATEKGGESYIIYNDANSNEYYLLENRQLTGWDASLPGKGLLIIHADYNATAWNNNTPNDNPSHQRMTWVAADNKYQYYVDNGVKYYTFEGMANDPFPYGSVNAFNKNTTPAAKLFNKNSSGSYYLECSIEQITQNRDSTISFDFVGESSVETPVFSPEAGRYSGPVRVTISCDTEGADIYYTTDGTKPGTDSRLYRHPFYISETTTVNAVAIVGEDESRMATANYVIGGDGNTFKRVESIADMVSGSRYIIACASQGKAAGGLSSNSSGTSSYLSSVDVEVDGDFISIGDDVSVFTLTSSGNEWIFVNEETGKYLYSSGTKKVNYSNSQKTWQLSDDDSGVIMQYGNYGTILFNSQTPRFTTYTSKPSSMMFYANLYKEYSSQVQILIGDANGDGIVNITDVTVTVEYILGNGNAEDLVFVNADVDGDGFITVSDVTFIVDIILGTQV
ncbi:MAG: M6 family metalloprotease domain-containing protein [Prevotella sp.]|nr:M6 family metalloprotease domain-containing protein [Prevotella sp.]